jgi:hypothetical protein
MNNTYKTSHFCSIVRTLVGLVKEGELDSSSALPFFIFNRNLEAEDGV